MWALLQAVTMSHCCRDIFCTIYFLDMEGWGVWVGGGGVVGVAATCIFHPDITRWVPFLRLPTTLYE